MIYMKKLYAQCKVMLSLVILAGALLSCEKDGPSKDGNDQEPLNGEYSAQGVVMYDDGKPAAGVKVSDGFTVVQTDENGQYAFKAAGKDVRYIYISYPADARITKTPGYYKKFKADRYVYDFKLIRQPVEKQFAFFAMADPQTHNKRRGSQTSADTDRFASETVPAINAEIAKQTLPCYGICLGDISYSEGTRDSNPALPVIKDHISKINMPVFSVMGNHDYTYYADDAPISTNAASSSINLVAQRAYEDVFGPVNFSFDRGNVHFVCMKDVYYKSEGKWAWSNYTGGFTDAEYNWLVQDLEKTPKSMKVVLCVHIPVATSNGPKMAEVKNLLNSFDDSVVFSGHTHYQRTILNGSELTEQIHAAVCGQWWWSKIEGDGCPNGYTVYHFDDKQIKDSYFIGVNDGMNTRNYQARIYKGDITTGGQYARFKMPYDYDGTYSYYLINVFNGDPRWTVKVYENGVYAGTATLLNVTGESYPSVTAGKTYSPAFGTNKDWWAIGYHIGVCKRGTTSTSYYTMNYHMWCWASKDKTAKISIEAVDPHGNTYPCDDVITNGESYPDYIKVPLAI